MQNSQQLKKIGLLAIVVLALGWFFYNRSQPTTMISNEPELEKTVEKKVVADKGTIEIGMSDFKFSQNSLAVKVGQTVTLKLTSLEGLHDFVIDELGVASEQISAGQETTVTFTIPASAAGQTYEYYCSVGNHHQLGMVGQLVVEGGKNMGQRVELKDVSGGVSSGVAYILRENGSLSHRVEAKLPAPATGSVYEGWLVSKAPTLKFFSTGVMKKEGEMSVLSYEADEEYLGYDEVVITLETKVDEIPEKHILEGTAGSGKN